MALDDYYQSEFKNGEAVDEALKRAAAGGALDQQLQRKVNPNLLDNWYFWDPVDTKGGYVAPPGIDYYDEWGIGVAATGTTDKYYTATHVTGGYADQYQITVDGAIKFVKLSDCVQGYTGAQQVINRWVNVGRDLTITLKNNALQIIFGSQYQIFDQRHNTPDILVGKTVTLSILYETQSSGIALQTGDTATILETGGPKVQSVTGVYANTQYAMDARLYNTVANSEITVYAIKLELGDQQTLAHQDADGNWVLNEIPNKAEQLAICSQYAPDTGELLGGWEHPPMLLGVEYRTTERYLGKPVYVKLVDCGKIVEGKSVNLGLDNPDNIISVDVIVNKAPSPSFYTSVGLGNYGHSYFVNYYNATPRTGSIIFHVGDSLNSQQPQGYVKVKYTKTTD